MKILDKAMEGTAPDKTECIYLLNLPEGSLGASLLCAAADKICRKRFGNEAIILGQIGIEIAPCPGRCKFCSFSQEHTAFAPQVMTTEEILERAAQFTASGDLFALFLMTMHTFELSNLLEVITRVQKQIPSHTQIIVNIGDFDLAQANELKSAGVKGVYHVCRLREGVDTALYPEDRKKTIQAIRKAGLDWYYCCEPVGPEHTPEELADQIFLGIEYGCFQHAAMRRIYIPSSPLAERGQITERKLAQVVAATALASLACKETGNIAVHEPNLLGLTSGANVVYAETGANPRDTEADTAGHRGIDIAGCRKMLYEAGFEKLQIGVNEKKQLSYS